MPGVCLNNPRSQAGVTWRSWAALRFRSSWSKLFLAVFFVCAGLMHFVVPDAYIRIVPPAFPAPNLLVELSGIAEILGGIGLLVGFTQRAAAWGLVLLLVAVFPANIYMAVSHVRGPGILGQSWAQWLRLPLQIPLILWALCYTRRPASKTIHVPDS